MRASLLLACAIACGCTTARREIPLPGAGPRPGESGLLQLRAHAEGRIPVVFVHGTASTAASWTELVDTLDDDPRIRERFEVWLFTYDGSSPTPHSARLLRSALAQAVARLDPDRNDPGLEQMIVVGHSQGGLLAKTTSIRSHAKLFETLSSGHSLSESPQRDAASKGSEPTVEPLPFVRSLIFVCTPHRGTLLAKLDSMRGFGVHLISLPLRFMRWSASVFTPGMDVASFSGIRALRAVENMSPSNEFLRALAATDVVPEVAMHSIVAVSGTGPIRNGHDGVVRYSSAHIRGVRSELVVRSGHSALNASGTINEVHRILLDYARDTPPYETTISKRPEPRA